MFERLEYTTFKNEGAIFSSMKQYRAIITILCLALLIISLANNPITTNAIYMVLESDILTTNGGTNYTVSYVRENDTWSAIAPNEFKFTIDVIAFSSDTLSLNAIQFGYRFRNEALGWNYESWSQSTGKVTPLTPFWEDRVSLDPTIKGDTPSQLSMSMGLRFVENLQSTSDKPHSIQWSDIIIITLSDTAPAISITDPVIFHTISYTETITATQTETMTVTNYNESIGRYHTPYLTEYPHDFYVDINQTDGLGYPYNVSWTIYGGRSDGFGNYGNITLDNNPNWSVNGSWSAGITQTINAPTPGRIKGVHTYKMMAWDISNNIISHEIYVWVVNGTGFYLDDPERASSLFSEYSDNLPPDFPISFNFGYSLSGIAIIILIYRKIKKS